MNEPRLNLPELTVSELSAALKRTIEDAYGYVRVRGELGKVSYHSNGHVYFDLKDDRACIAGIIWRSTAARIKLKLEAGLEVVVTGRITTYPGRSQYQIVAETLEPAGLGALMALLEERKRQLNAEGLFDEARKQLLPYLPAVIGVITSPTGAVIRDILHRLGDRFPRQFLVWPVKVQGEDSAREVAAAIAGFNRFAERGAPPRPDLLIVARGGGSLEDLWSFNEEIVVRAAAESLIPLISAVGHETDVTLLDFVADRRAPTPSAAAEMAVPVRSELIIDVEGLERRALAGWLRAQEARRNALALGVSRLAECRRSLRLAAAASRSRGAHSWAGAAGQRPYSSHELVADRRQAEHAPPAQPCRTPPRPLQQYHAAPARQRRRQSRRAPHQCCAWPGTRRGLGQTRRTAPSIISSTRAGRDGRGIRNCSRLFPTAAFWHGALRWCATATAARCVRRQPWRSARESTLNFLMAASARVLKACRLHQGHASSRRGGAAGRPLIPGKAIFFNLPANECLFVSLRDLI